MNSISQDEVLDSMSDEISLDIINLIKNNNTGNFSLPEDSSGEDYYFLDVFDYEFSVDIDITIENSVKNYDVDFELYFDDQEIYVAVILNQNYNMDENSDLYYDLIEGIRHELEHIKQYLNGFKRKKEPSDHEKYYTQNHELEALKSGFRKRALKEKKSIEDVVRRWFKVNGHKFTMDKDQIERVINKILN